MIHVDFFKNLRTQLFGWYVGSLFFLAAYFFIVVHAWQFRYSIGLFIILFVGIAVVGFFITLAVIRSLTKLSTAMKRISSTNLDARLPTIGYHGEIRELSQSFNDLLDRLHEAFTRERQFIGDLAHELKTPLTIQRGMIEITLSKERSNDEYRKALQEVFVDNTTIASTLKNILDLAWAEADYTGVFTKPVNLSQIVTDLDDLTDKLAKQKGISITKKVSSPVYVLGKEDKLARAVFNILDNAIKYSHSQGEVKIIVWKNHQTAFVSVKDRGIGIAKEDIPHIFERFYRGSTRLLAPERSDGGQETGKTLGSGLGLAISHAIITAHHGSISIKSSLNKGTTVIISLPIAHPS